MISPLGRVAAGIVLASVLLAGAALDTRSTLEAENEALRAQIAAGASATAVLEAQHAHLDELVAELHSEQAVLDELVAARAPFLEEVAAFAEQVARAAGKVDAADVTQRVLAAQDDVLDERADPAAVEAAGIEVSDATAELSRLVDEYDAEQERLAAAAAAQSRDRGAGAPASNASAPAGTPSGGASDAGAGGEESGASAFGTIRAALDTVGGGGVPLEESPGACGLACASSRGVITFHPALAQESWSKILWVMSHELAHIHQFRVWNSLQGSATYSALYGGDIEHLANCMATVRGFASTGCTADQLGYAAGVWSGQVG